MSYKKFVIISIVLICVFFSLSFIIKNLPIGYFSLSAEDYSNIERRTDVKSTLDTLAKEEERILLEIKQNNTCYWIRPRRNENGYFIEILEYGKEFGECLGAPRNKTYIRVDQKLSMYSPGCVCEGNYVLERKPGGLKISKVE